MPTPKRRLPKRKTAAGELTREQGIELVAGQNGENNSAFPSEAARKRAWEQYGAEIIEEFIPGKTWGESHYGKP